MSRNPQSRGICAFCKEEFSKGGMRKHLELCPKRAFSISKTIGTPTETLWHLRVEDAYVKDFWLDLEMRGSYTLSILDEYLRAIWLECCGHLSEFTIGGFGGTEIAISRKADSIFKTGLVLRHLYDYGTTSETDIRVLDSRIGTPLSKHPIFLMSRNLQPKLKCQECNQPAVWLCMECLIEGDTKGTLCEKHVEDHPHTEYGEPIEIVNSPRVGMCGYEGPAEPPY